MVFKGFGIRVSAAGARAPPADAAATANRTATGASDRPCQFGNGPSTLPALEFIAGGDRCAARFCTSRLQRPLERSATPAFPGRQPGIPGHHRDRRLPPAQRHDAVAAAGDLSGHQGWPGPEFRTDRPGHAGLPGHRLAAAAAGRRVCGPPTYAARAPRWHAVHAGGPGRAFGCAPLRAGAHRRGADRHRLLGIPPGSLARRAHGLGRTSWTRAVDVPGRRQQRPGPGSARRGTGGSALRAVEPGAVRAAGAAVRCHPVERQRLVPPPRAGAPARRRVASAEPGCRRSGDRPTRDRAAAAADLLEVHLPDQHDQLFHVLSDPSLRCVDPRRAAAPVRLHRRHCARYAARRAGRPIASGAGA